MTYIQKITNGQLDIPREIWEALQWSKNDVKVKIETTKKGFRVEKISSAKITPKKKKLTEKEWDKIFKNMERIRKAGRQDVNLTEFIRHDRDTHL